MFWPIDETDLGMVIEVKPVQFSNALLPIEVTELGMVTEVKLVQPINAYLFIWVTSLGITNSVISVPLSLSVFAR